MALTMASNSNGACHKFTEAMLSQLITHWRGAACDR
jgi:hypothetical protein